MVLLSQLLIIFWMIIILFFGFFQRFSDLQYVKKELENEKTTTYEEKNVVVDHKFSIKQQNVDEVYLKCIDWIEKIDGGIIEKDNPVYLLAIYPQGYVRVGKHNPLGTLSKIIIKIELSNIIDEVNIQFKLFPSRMQKIVIDLENRRFKWSKLLEDFYRFLDIELNSEILKKIYPVYFFNKSLQKKISKIYMWVLLNSIYLISLALGVSFTKNQIIHDWLYILYILCIPMILLLMDAINDYFKIKKKFNEIFL